MAETGHWVRAAFCANRFGRSCEGQRRSCCLHPLRFFYPVPSPWLFTQISNGCSASGTKHDPSNQLCWELQTNYP